MEPNSISAVIWFQTQQRLIPHRKEPDMSAPSPAGPSAAAVKAIKEKAKLLSIYSMMATTAAGSGHPTSCMSAAELMAGVFFHAMTSSCRTTRSPV
jgi:transketolase